MKNPLKTFEPNIKGRDFAIGDLHGSYSVLMNLLKNLNFDQSVDRMFSVGDLVDRGPSSQKCLALLYEPWFHAVLSNHEQMMLEAFDGGYMGNFWVQNGGAWGLEAYAEFNRAKKQSEGTIVVSDEVFETWDLVKKVHELPFLMTINMQDGRKFHMLHAELPPSAVGITDSDLSSPERVRELATDYDGRNGDSFLWSRFHFGSYSRTDLSNQNKLVRTAAYKYKGSTGPYNKNLSHIISGHSILQRPLTLIGQTNIDTGAYMTYPSNEYGTPSWAGLTCINLNTWEFYQATETRFKQIEPVVISAEEIHAEHQKNFK